MGFTRNYKNLLMTIIANPYGRTSSEYDAIPSVFDDSTFFTFKATNGTIYKRVWSYTKGFNNSNVEVSQNNNGGLPTIGHLSHSSCSHPAKQLIFGTNDAEESVDDYNIVMVNLSFPQPPKITNYTYANGKLTMNYSCVIQSTGDVTLNEMGIRYQMNISESYSGATNGAAYTFLLYRKKLDTPIVLKANEAQLVTFSIDVNYPTDDMLNGITTQLDEIIDGGE